MQVFFSALQPFVSPKPEMRCVVLLAAVLGVVAGHDWDLGTCPRPSSYPSLDVDKFLGIWFVISQVDTTSTCLTMDYKRADPTQLTVEKSRQILLLDTLKVKHLNRYTATLDIPDGNDAGRMRVKWPLNVAGKADYTVMATDYTNYAVVFECQQLSPLISRKSASILSRDVTLAEEKKRELLRLVEENGISLSDMDFVDHSKCIDRSEAAVNINIDEETIKKLMSDASTNIRSVVKQVADGAGELYGTVSDLARRLANFEDNPNAATNSNNPNNLVDLSEIEILE